MKKPLNHNKVWALLGTTGLMILWLVLALALTGGREIRAFTDRDKWVFGAFLTLEAVSLGTVIYLIVDLLRWNRDTRKQLPPPEPEQRRSVRQQNLLGVVGLFAALLSMILGSIMARRLGPSPVLGELGLALALLPMACMGIGILLTRRLTRRFRDMKVAEQQRMVLSHRERAQEMAAKKLQRLKLIRRAVTVYGWFLLFVSLMSSFLVGCKADGGMSGYTICLCAFSAMGAAIRLGARPVRFDFSEDKGYVSEEAYPRLYALARQAADALGMKAALRICLDESENAGIARIGQDCSVSLGAVLLSLQSEQELYEVLLHEFAHVAGERDSRERAYRTVQLQLWNQSGFLGLFQKLLFDYPDRLYATEYEFYLFASSLEQETKADEAMVRYGDRQTAASSLLRLKYPELSAWEAEGQDGPFLDTLEKKIHDMTRGRIQRALDAETTRREFYRELIRREIMSRSASHPTIQMRLDALGCPDGQLKERWSSPEYVQETERAVDQVQQWLLARNDSEDYARQVSASRRIVDDWEAAGRPLQMEDYADVVNELRAMGRLRDAMDLCDRAIRELPVSAARYALYIRGCCRLHRWQDEGIEDIYEAIAGNSNYIEEGCDLIGSYCCLTGNQAELDRYREKALQLAQEQKDVYSEMDELRRGDDLSPETLPPELAEKLRAFFRTLPKGKVKAVYLIHKQIAPDFSCSPVILRFASDVERSEREELLHKTFLFLDAVDEWQFSLFPYEAVENVRPERIDGSLFFTGE